MSYDVHDTIAAVATAAGGAARGMVRVGGPEAVAVAERSFAADNGRPLKEIGSATYVSGRIQIDLEGRATGGVPCDLFVWPSARSYTRQPVVELHTLGSRPILDAVLAAACRAGARLAEPGEFTLRAFLAGRIDLTQAEAVLGVIDSRSQDELTASLAQLAGGLSHPLQQLRDELLQLLAELEAGLDFVEEDIEFISAREMIERLEGARSTLAEVAEQMASRMAEAPLDQVALVGPPNAGKSSLYNALVQRHGAAQARQSSPAAIVSPMSGTTRDYLTATIELGGIRCELVDTAGDDELAAGQIAAAAQNLSSQCREQATLRIWCSDGVDDTTWPADCDLLVLTKADVVRRREGLTAGRVAGRPIVVTSSRTGEGLPELESELRRLIAQDSTAQSGAIVAATAERSRESVRLANAALARAIELVRNGSGEELVAAEVRDALAKLGKVVGAVYTDDLLDRIFNSFCIGK